MFASNRPIYVVLNGVTLGRLEQDHLVEHFLLDSRVAKLNLCVLHRVRLP